MKIPRIVIAGTNSGCGKTTVTAGIMAALVKRGLRVQPFKVGPDYIDPMFHTFVTGRASRNLDSWLLKEEVVSHLFVKNSQDADIAVVEGVMGFYDGFGVHSFVGSTAHISKIIASPVTLVVNAEGLSVSIAAIIKGFKDFDSAVDIRGVIINNIKSERHYLLLKEAIEKYTDVAVIGYLMKSECYSLSSRHLGLVPSEEIGGLRDKMSSLAEEIEKTIDLELLLSIAEGAKAISSPQVQLPEIRRDLGEKRPVIAVAKDKAFNFYYIDNLDMLEAVGATLKFFSPVEDKALPGDVDGLYIGGGYPEVWAEELEANAPIRKAIKSAVEQGMPVYAECGGFMYMTENIRNSEGKAFNMVGCIPGESSMTTRLQRFGYVEVEIAGGSIFSEKPQKVNAHEFHYSTSTVSSELRPLYKVSKPGRTGSKASWGCGYRVNNLIAGYPHIHFWANPELAVGFIESCRRYGSGR